MPLAPRTDEACLQDGDDVPVVLEQGRGLLDVGQHPVERCVWLRVGIGAEVVREAQHDLEACFTGGLQSDLYIVE